MWISYIHKGPRSHAAIEVNFPPRDVDIELKTLLAEGLIAETGDGSYRLSVAGNILHCMYLVEAKESGPWTLHELRNHSYVRALERPAMEAAIDHLCQLKIIVAVKTARTIKWEF